MERSYCEVPFLTSLKYIFTVSFSEHAENAQIGAIRKAKILVGRLFYV